MSKETDLHSPLPIWFTRSEFVDKETLVLSAGPNTFWMKLGSGNKTVEGKLFLPAQATAKIIILEPGFSGGGSTAFERAHQKQLMNNGWALFTIRHNGTILNGKHSDGYIDCPEREQYALDQGQKIIGSDPQSSFQQWFSEPLIALQELVNVFQEIVLFGHSLGSLAILSSLILLAKKKSECLNKVRRVVSLAGVTGIIRSESDPVLNTDDLEESKVQESVRLVPAKENIKALMDATAKMHIQAGLLPEHISLVCLNAWGDTADSIDEFVSPEDAIDLIVSMRRGTLIIDKTQQADPIKNVTAHDLSALSSETILKLADFSWQPKKQILTLDSQGLH